MELDLSDIAGAFRGLHQARYSQHAVGDRVRPSILQYDYLHLSTLAADVARLIGEVPSRIDSERPVALDLGCGSSPYRELLLSRGFRVETLDIDPRSSADHVAGLEATGLPDEFADLVLCTQVLEHSGSPATGMREVFRVLRPGGHLIASAPHIWFYHPHPSDNWRFTQEGLIRLVAGAGFVPLRLVAQGGSVLSLFQVVNFLVFGVVGRIGAPFYAVNNVVGKLADRVLRNSLFSLNFAVLAEKPLR